MPDADNQPEYDFDYSELRPEAVIRLDRETGEPYYITVSGEKVWVE